MNKTYALIRVSSDKQDFNSQLEGINNYCKQNNITLPTNHIIEEYGVSGYKTQLEHRQGLKKIEELAEQGAIDTLLIFNLDRIGRRTDLLPFITKMTLAEVDIISVTEGIINNDNDVNELLTFIKLWANQGESKKTSARVKSGKLKTAKEGLWNGGKVNLGYKVENKKLVVDDTVAPIIREAYNKYISEGTKATCEYLSLHNIKKTQQTLLQLLSNPIYKGVYSHNKELYSDEDYDILSEPNEELRIVTDEVWEKARGVAKERQSSQGSRCKSLNRTDCIYEGLLYHACGNRLTIDYDYRKSPKKMIFKCRHCKSHKIDTWQKTYSADKLLPVLDNAVDDLFLDLDREKLENVYTKHKEKQLTNLHQLVYNINISLTNKKKSLDKANNKLKIMLVNDTDIDTIQIITSTIKELKEEIEELEIKKNDTDILIGEERKALETSNSVIDSFITMKDIYHKGSKKKQKNILQILVDKIIVTDYNNINIVINIR